VQHPGEFPYEDGLGVNAIIEKAGGIDGEAVRQLTVIRIRDGKSNPNGIASVTRLAATGETVLMAGDLLEVATYKSDLIRPHAQKVLDWISANDFDNVILSYEGPMRASAFETKLRTEWQQFQQQAGTFQRPLTVRTELRGVNYVAVVSCQFSRSNGQLIVVFNHGGGILDVSLASATT
jgi:hypothetical protein